MRRDTTCRAENFPIRLVSLPLLLSTSQTNEQNFIHHFISRIQEKITEHPPDRSAECGGSTCDESGLALRNEVRKWEAKLRDKQLLDVWAAYIIRLGELNYAKNLHIKIEKKYAKNILKCHIRESTGSEHGGGQPCLGRAP